LNKCRDDIHEVCARITSLAGESPKADTTDELTRLDTLVTKWTRFTKPIQQAMKSRGLGDQQTTEIAQHIRSVAIDLANNSSLYSEARRITATLHRAFEENPAITEMTRDDLQTLDDLLSAKAEQENSSPAIKGLKALCSDVRQECRSRVVRKEGFSDANKRVCAEALQRFRQEIEPALKSLLLSSSSDSKEILKERE